MSAPTNSKDDKPIPAATVEPANAYVPTNVVKPRYRFRPAEDPPSVGPPIWKKVVPKFHVPALGYYWQLQNPVPVPPKPTHSSSIEDADDPSWNSKRKPSPKE